MTTSLIATTPDDRARMPLLRRPRQIIGISGAALLAFFLGGCAGNDPGEQSSPSEVAEAADPPVQDLVDFGAWPDAINQRIQSGNADYTIVDYWSLSCAPCLKELPELAKLSREQTSLGKEARFQTIGVSLDFYGSKSKPPQYYEVKIRDMLDRIDAQFVNVICETASDEVFAGLEIASIPAVFVYDRDGTLVKRFVDTGDTAGFTYESDVIPFLDSLE